MKLIIKYSEIESSFHDHFRQVVALYKINENILGIKISKEKLVKFIFHVKVRFVNVTDSHVLIRLDKSDLYETLISDIFSYLQENRPDCLDIIKLLPGGLLSIDLTQTIQTTTSLMKNFSLTEINIDEDSLSLKFDKNNSYSEYI